MDNEKDEANLNELGCSESQGSRCMTGPEADRLQADRNRFNPIPDGVLHDRVQDTLSAQPIDVSEVTFTVHDGVVRLKGVVESQESRLDLKRALEPLVGVLSIEDELSTREPEGLGNRSGFEDTRNRSPRVEKSLDQSGW